jgi:hypothetical protein
VKVDRENEFCPKTCIKKFSKLPRMSVDSFETIESKIILYMNIPLSIFVPIAK